MSTTTRRTPDQEIEYPDSDGEPMAENTLQYEWITTIKGGLDILFQHDPDFFVAGDLVWYPVEGDNTTRLGPDVLVALGRPKGHRGSYMQWREAGVAPQVVFEILSPGNRAGELARKFRFYETHGVEEYYVYNPDDNVLEGWLPQGDRLVRIPEPNWWTSPRLGVRFEIGTKPLRLYGPDDRPFATLLELAERADEHRARPHKSASGPTNNSARPHKNVRGPSDWRLDCGPWASSPKHETVGDRRRYLERRVGEGAGRHRLANRENDRACRS
jgi:Uma2 family endonuclease